MGEFIASLSIFGLTILGIFVIIPYIIFIHLAINISRMNTRLDDISETLIALTNDRRWRDTQDGKQLRPKDVD